MAQKRVDLRDAVLFVITSVAGPTSTGYSTPNPPDSIWGCVQFGEGNFTATMNDSADYVTDRGKLDDVRFGDEAPMDISFEGKFVGLRLPPYPNSGATYSLEEMVTGKIMDNSDYGGKLGGLPEPWLIAESPTADLTACVPYCSWLELHINPRLSCPNQDIVGEAQLYRFFRAPTVQIDIDAGQVSVTGNAHILTPVVRRLQLDYTTLAGAVPLFDDGLWSADPRE